MAYESGDLKLSRWADPESDEYYDEARVSYDARGEHPKWDVAYLPHSCDEWVIGGPDELRALISDAQAMLQEMEAKS